MKYLRNVTLQTIISWLAIAVVVGFFLSITLSAGWWLARSSREDLVIRARSLANSLAVDAVEPVLLDDAYAAYNVLQRSSLADKEIRYAFIMLQERRIIAHTFDSGFPRELLQYCLTHDEPLMQYRTRDDYILDVAVPVLDGELGHLHLGMSQKRVLHQQRYFSMAMLLVLGTLLAASLLVAQLISWHIGQPLVELATVARRVPGGNLRPSEVPATGTAEIRQLSLAFQQMVTDLRRLKAENLSAQKRMVSAERLATLGEMSAGLAHEILNPLDGIMECCRQLEPHMPAESRQARYVQLIHDGLRRIERVMRQMLVFARAPGKTPDISDCALHDLISDMIELTRPRLERYGIQLDAETSLANRCRCARPLVEQALLNLLLNAADACGESAERRICIWGMVRDEWVDIHVEDSGSGIAEADRERVFRPFFSSKDPGKGTGLGLTVSRDLIEQNGGELVLERSGSRLSGAHFRISLPLSLDTDERSHRS